MVTHASGTFVLIKTLEGIILDKTSLNIRNLIFDVIKKEDSDLAELNKNKGIFFLPELGLTYMIGKALVKNAVDVFGCDVKSWDAEWGLGIISPIDLVIELENNVKYLFEFKTRQKSASYINDIRKLRNISLQNTEKYFCAFIDCPLEYFPHPKRIKSVEYDIGKFIERVSEEEFFKSFDAIDHYNGKKLKCIFAMWRIKG